MLYRIDTSNATSGTSTMALRCGAVSAGNYRTLGDGDVLALVDESSGAAVSSLVRLHPDGTSTVVGRLPTTAYGMAQVSGGVHLSDSSGDLLQLSILPNTASTAALRVTTLATTGLDFWGATSTQDSGSCNALTSSPSASYPASTPVVPTVSRLSPSATGTVASTAGATPLCTLTLPATSCTAPALLPGTCTAVGTCSGNGQTSTTTFTVLLYPTAPPLAAQVMTPTGLGSVPLVARTAQLAATSSGGGAITCTSSPSPPRGSAWTARLVTRGCRPAGGSHVPRPSRTSSVTGVADLRFLRSATVGDAPCRVPDSGAAAP